VRAFAVVVTSLTLGTVRTFAVVFEASLTLGIVRTFALIFVTRPALSIVRTLVVGVVVVPSRIHGICLSFAGGFLAIAPH
jgi:hypothetical protein